MKISKVLKIVIFFVAIIILMTTIANAFSVSGLTGTIDANNEREIKTIGGKILTYVTAIGIVVSVVTLIIIGIKYMLGSVEEKAGYKKSLMPYVIGAFLTFAASTLAQIIYEIAIKIK